MSQRQDSKDRDRRRERSPVPRNKKLTGEEVDELRRQNRCYWCFQNCDVCKQTVNKGTGRCKMFGMQRPWAQ